MSQSTIFLTLPVHNILFPMRILFHDRENFLPEILRPCSHETLDYLASHRSGPGSVLGFSMGHMSENLVINLPSVGGFLWVLRFPSPVKLTFHHQHFTPSI